jgi:hypothetical protein
MTDTPTEPDETPDEQPDETVPTVPTEGDDE